MMRIMNRRSNCFFVFYRLYSRNYFILTAFFIFHVLGRQLQNSETRRKKSIQLEMSCGFDELISIYRLRG